MVLIKVLSTDTSREQSLKLNLSDKHLKHTANYNCFTNKKSSIAIVFQMIKEAKKKLVAENTTNSEP